MAAPEEELTGHESTRRMASFAWWLRASVMTWAVYRAWGAWRQHEWGEITLAFCAIAALWAAGQLERRVQSHLLADLKGWLSGRNDFVDGLGQWMPRAIEEEPLSVLLERHLGSLPEVLQYQAKYQGEEQEGHLVVEIWTKERDRRLEGMAAGAILRSTPPGSRFRIEWHRPGEDATKAEP